MDARDTKRKCYDATYKLVVVSRTDQLSMRATAKEFGIDEKQVREWCRQKPELMKMCAEGGRKRKRCSGGGMRPLYSVQEEAVAQRILHLRELHLRVLRKDISVFAKEEITDPTFHASAGWVARIMKRWGFVIRQKTSVGQHLPQDLEEKVANFVKKCNTIRERHHLPQHCIGNMDETAIWADMPGNSTIAVRGSKSVPILTTGHEKQRITVCLAAMADGTKLPPFVVLKGKRMLKDVASIPNVIVRMSKNAWMDEDLTSEWVDKIWEGAPLPGKRLLVWDLFKCHSTQKVKTQLQQSNSIVVYVPPGCTKVVQPADVSWNAPFKVAYRDLYSQWMAEGEQERTPAGNMRAPSKPLMVQWVVRAWEAITKETIVRSFEACGITTSDPDRIHCTSNASGLALAAYPVLKSFHARLTQSIDIDGKESDDSEWSSSDEDAAENADEDEEVDVE